MTIGQDASGDALLDVDRELEQAQRVRHLRARTTDTVCELVLRDTEFLEQLRIGVRLFQRVELHTVDVLQQRVTQHGAVFRVTDDGRDGGQARLGGRAPAALTHDELKAAVLRGTNDDGLEQAELLDGVDELLELAFLEDRARLLRVGNDVPDGNLAVRRSDGRRLGLAAACTRARLRGLSDSGRALDSLPISLVNGS